MNWVSQQFSIPYKQLFSDGKNLYKMWYAENVKAQWNSIKIIDERKRWYAVGVDEDAAGVVGSSLIGVEHDEVWLF